LNARENFEKLKGLLDESTRLVGVATSLEWEMQTWTPEEAQPGMAAKKSMAEKLAHRAFTKEPIGAALRTLVSQKDQLERSEGSLVERLCYCYERMRVLPPEFVEKKSQTTAKAYDAWQKAKEKKDFSLFAPHLKKVIELTREEALLYGAEKDNIDSIYTSLLGGYEPGMTVERLKEILDQVKQWLVPVVKKIKSSPVKPDDEKLADRLLKGIFPKDKQRMLCEALLHTFGYNFKRGNLTETAHPFMASVGPKDHRVTTHFLEDYLPAALFGVAHEGGHALFAQGHNPMLEAMVVYGFIISMGIHESQSRMCENIVCRSPEFWQYFYPVLQAVFPQYYEVEIGDFVRAINVVRSNPIRIYSDEVTYNLHILLRFELEYALLSGELQVEDLPEAFAKKMVDYLGIEPEDVSKGVLQDVHWSIGLFGYFPTYLLGNLGAAQYFARFQKEFLIYRGKFERGNFSLLLQWLRPKVHLDGYYETLDESLMRVTGEALNPKYWFEYILKKFDPFYKITGPDISKS